MDASNHEAGLRHLGTRTHFGMVVHRATSGRSGWGGAHDLWRLGAVPWTPSLLWSWRLGPQALSRLYP